MITTNLFQQVLIDPALNECDRLLIISGYASSAMAFHHLTELKNRGNEIAKINLIIGMSSTDGISLSNHKGFREIMEREFPERFICSYRPTRPPVHSKVYLWLSGNEPKLAFLGSPNYSQFAFNENRQMEAVLECPPQEALEYYESMVDDSIYCTHPDSENIIQIFNDRFIRRPERIIVEQAELETALPANIETLESVRVSLLDRNGNIHNRAGLNWGQRPGREPNQAYLQLSPSVHKSNFFPLRSIHFTVFTDDNKTFICTRAHKNPMGAGIETPQNNSLIGEYFRNRLGLPNGAFVRKEDLIRYGRTEVTFYKIDDENYYMDFST